MDAVSYGLASKQAKRIESFIENPDSSSGIVTVPKTIASGETITIPAGRVAILPNVQIDGVLNVEGEVFIPSGSTLSTVVEKVTSTDNAIVRFDGTTGAVQNSAVTVDDNGTLLVTSSAGGLGYGTGSGGTVTQLTSKSTAVTLKKPTGRIVMNNAALAAGGSVKFTLQNTLITDNDTVLVNISPVFASYEVMSTNGNNGCDIILKNKTAGSLSEAVILQFNVFKGAAV